MEYWTTLWNDLREECHFPGFFTCPVEKGVVLMLDRSVVWSAWRCFFWNHSCRHKLWPPHSQSQGGKWGNFDMLVLQKTDSVNKDRDTCWKNDIVYTRGNCSFCFSHKILTRQRVTEESVSWKKVSCLPPLVWELIGIKTGQSWWWAVSIVISASLTSHSAYFPAESVRVYAWEYVPVWFVISEELLG